MPNLWLEHVKKIRDENKGKPLKEILKMAKKTYKSSRVNKKQHSKTHRNRKLRNKSSKSKSSKSKTYKRRKHKRRK